MNLLLDAIHAEGHFAEEDNVRTEAATADAVAYFVQAAIGGVVFDWRTTAIALATGFCQFSMHVEKADRTGTLMQVVDILGAEKEAFAKAMFEFGQGEVGGVWLGLLCGEAASRIELPNQAGIALPCFWSADILDPMAGPKAV